MSVVSNIILCLPVLEDGKIKEVNAYFTNNGRKDFFDDQPIIGNGRKCIEKPTWAAGFNYFMTEEFVKFVSEINWDDPEEVQIFACEHEEEIYTRVL